MLVQVIVGEANGILIAQNIFWNVDFSPRIWLMNFPLTGLQFD